VTPATLEGEMWTLKKFTEYMEQLGAVEKDLSDGVRIPDISDEERSDDTRLATEDAIALLRYYRDAPEWRGKRGHAFLELAWNVGARMGGLRALDLRDVHLDERYVEFKHRPETDTPLKNKFQGERAVAITGEVADVLRRFIEYHRHDEHDEHGRQPLLASSKGRPTTNTLRNWSYLATEPCIFMDCPHGKARETCDWAVYNHASQCPSSRSPHQIRTGSITWQLNRGVPPQVVSERVNASLDTIEQHYDKETPVERMERRRRQHVQNLTLNDDTPTDD
jgi:integrase